MSDTTTLQGPIVITGAGQAGVQNLLEALRNELAVAMALCGVSRLEQINAELLEPCQAG